MGKQGPCGHCGIATTPLWRNGPPEKPVLCNACGSRWRTKGTLLNYMPMHSGGFGGVGNPEGTARRKKGSHRLSSDPPRSHKRKEPYGGRGENRTPTPPLPLLLKDAEEELKTASSLESGVSGPDKVALFRSSPVWIPAWVGPVPSRKRTSMVRACTSLEKLISRFQDLMNESPSVNSSPATPSESSDVMLVESKPSTMAMDVGVNSVFLQRAPMPLLQEPPGDTISFLMESAGNLKPTQALPHGTDTRVTDGVMESPNGAAIFPAQMKEKATHSLKKMEIKVVRRENFPYHKRDVLQSCQSPLVFLELKDIINFDTYTGLLTDQEQRQLAKLVSSLDISRVPESLKEMFNSGQFVGALNNFQQLLSEGMFDSSEPGMSAHILQHFQQLLTISDLNNSGWMEQSSQLQSHGKCQSGSSNFFKNKESTKDKTKRFGVPVVAVGTGSINHSLGKLPGQSEESSGEELHAATYKQTECGSNLLPYSGLSPLRYAHSLKLGTPDIGSSPNDGGIAIEEGGTYFTGNAVSVDDLPDIQVPGSDGMEPDLLFDLSSNILAFQEAELLQQPAWTKSKEESEPNQVENGSLIMSNIWHMDNNFSELFWNPSCGSPGNGLPNGAVLNPGRMLI
ncbi:unnamed protein product [Sphagnum jensenii]|uniref:GATA-type domain-containing protein n=1 Tax=Sphagnum jensenii TaxID=128206 RepID=A0ABP1A5L2_9BRYO